MLRFECDYGEGAAPAVLELLQKTNFDQAPGYGEDEYCAKAAAQIKRLCDAPDADVHFFVGATQANLTVIAAALKPWQACCAPTPGTSMCTRPAPSSHRPQVPGAARQKRQDHSPPDPQSRGGAPRQRQPRARGPARHGLHLEPHRVGTLYNKEELTDISAACYELGLYLFVDGARMPTA